MFIESPAETPEAAAMYRQDITERGYVMNLSRLWAWRPEVARTFTRLRSLLGEQSSLSARERSVLVCATAGTLGDSHCALVWGTSLSSQSSPSTAAAVLGSSEPTALPQREQALAAWARKVVQSPNTTNEEDLASLRRTGLSDQEIFDATVFVAFRLAFSTVNDALGARPDRQLAERAPQAVLHAVTFGRAVDAEVMCNGLPLKDA
jgi:uncharacterized peroxidase-related enzyme